MSSVFPMLSKKEYVVVVQCVKLCCCFGLLPADWNHGTERIVYPSRRKWKGYVAIIMLPIYACYAIFIQFRLSAELKDGGGVEKVLLHLLFSCAYALCALYHCHVLRSPREIATLFNLLRTFDQNQGVELLNGAIEKHSWIRETSILAQPRAIAALIVAVGSTVFFKAENSNFLYSAFPYKNPASFILFAGFENGLLIQLAFLGTFIFTFVIYYVMTTRFWLVKILHIGNEGKVTETSEASCTRIGDWKLEVANTGRKLKHYKMLYILNEMYNRSWSNLMIPGFKMLIIVVCVSALYGTIRFSTSIEFFVFIWCPMMVAFLFSIMTVVPPLFASIQERSAQVIGKQEGSRQFRNSLSIGKGSKMLELGIVKRELGSCRPLSCKAGSLYSFDRNTGLTCLNLIFQMTAYFLLGLGTQ